MIKHLVSFVWFSTQWPRAGRLAFSEHGKVKTYLNFVSLMLNDFISFLGPNVKLKLKDLQVQDSKSSLPKRKLMLLYRMGQYLVHQSLSLIWSHLVLKLSPLAPSLIKATSMLWLGANK